jgi:hypothetical protein
VYTFAIGRNPIAALVVVPCHDLSSRTTTIVVDLRQLSSSSGATSPSCLQLRVALVPIAGHGMLPDGATPVEYRLEGRALVECPILYNI